MGANYTVVESSARDFPGTGRTLIGEAELNRLAVDLGRRCIGDLGDPDLGEAIATSRTSWVRRVESSLGPFFVKTYVYPTTWERLRAAARWTGPWRPSRALREARALAWLDRTGFTVPSVLGVHETRSLGLLTRAILVTSAWPGDRVDRWLEAATPTERLEIAAALGQLVGRLHHLGFRDGNLDLRNLLGRRAGSTIALAKIDSPRFRLRPPGRTDDRLTRADWRRLTPQIERFGIAAEVVAAARQTIAARERRPN